MANGPYDPCPCGSGRKTKFCCGTARPARNSAAAPPGAAPNAGGQFLNIPFLSQQAVQLHQAGHFGQAEALYRQILQVDPNHAATLHLLGVLSHQTGRNEAAVDLIGRAIARNGNVADFHNNLGLALQALGRFEQSAARYRQALRLRPQYPEACNNLGTALQAQGKLGEAAESYRRATELKPAYVEAHFNLGVALEGLGRLEEAAESYRHALRLRPMFAEAHNNLGNVLRTLGRLDEAASNYRQALRLKPDSANACNNLGAVLLAQGQVDEAAASYREALRLQPDLAEAHNNLGIALQAQNKLDEAAPCFRQALQLVPDYPEALASLGATLQEQGHIEQAVQYYERVLALRPNDGIRIKLATMLPVIMGSREDIRTSRDRFEQNIDALLEQGITLADPVSEVAWASFFLSYHGLDDRPLQEKLARLYERACPSLLFEAPHCRAPAPLEGRRIRIGFVSRHLKDHTIGKLTAGLVARLSRDLFDVRVFFLPQKPDEMVRMIEGSADRSETLSPFLDAARAQIAAHELDILFYPDIGMDHFTYFLAYSRLAPVQCVTWGHPVTTGIRNMDYFISSQHLEPEGAQAQYSEKLVRLHSLPCYYRRPQPPAPLKGRAHFGLPRERHLYLCPQSLFKFHPDFDPVLADILRRDPDGLLVLIEGTHPHWTEMLRARFAAAMPDVIERVRFLPRQPTADFLNLIAVCDVLLDPFHFGGGNTAYEALALGSPIVTLPGRFLRGRVTYACYRRMGVTDCVVDTPEAYAELAVRLGTEPDFRDAVRARILGASAALYEDSTAVRELEGFFVEALQEKLRTPMTTEARHA